MIRDLKGRAAEILKRLGRKYPDAHCELDFSSVLELAVAAILSAQCTDKRVNGVTPPLFRKYRTAADWAAADPATLEGEIRSTGFFRNKAKSIRALCARLVERHGGEVPGDFDTLVALPGIGRKTAHLLMGTAFGQPGMIVDTHCGRVSRRLGLTSHTDPAKVEADLCSLAPRKAWTTWSHRMVFHGRYCCFARKPDCAACPLTDLCPFYTAAAAGVSSRPVPRRSLSKGPAAKRAAR
jgi:endonuclease-3